MGNCLVLQQKKVIKIMKTDGKILEYKAPKKVHQVLSEFSGHAISDTLPVYRYLQPEAEMVGGHLYYLLPILLPLPEIEKKRLRFSNPVVEGGEGTGGVVRIKLVITKQELKEMLRKGGVLVDDMVSQQPNKESITGVDDGGNCNGWKPFLESIPEVDEYMGGNLY